ncbi:6690_t:CDS:1, partial [Racocetra fulgida]
MTKSNLLKNESDDTLEKDETLLKVKPLTKIKFIKKQNICKNKAPGKRSSLCD